MHWVRLLDSRLHYLNIYIRIRLSHIRKIGTILAPNRTNRKHVPIITITDGFDIDIVSLLESWRSHSMRLSSHHGCLIDLNPIRRNHIIIRNHVKEATWAQVARIILRVLVCLVCHVWILIYNIWLLARPISQVSLKEGIS